MNDAITQGARAAAQRLTNPARASLADDVEAALASNEATSDQYADPAALGSLIVSVATLAWTVYNDIRSRGAAAPSADTVTRRVRHQVDQADAPAAQLDPAERDRIIDVTVEETLSAAQDQDPENP